MSTKKISELKPHKPRRKPYKKPSRKGYYKYVPKTHYYDAADIHPKEHKLERMKGITCWICGKAGHTSNLCLEAKESRKNLGRKSQQKYKG